MIVSKGKSHHPLKHKGNNLSVLLILPIKWVSECFRENFNCKNTHRMGKTENRYKKAVGRRKD